MKASNLPLPQRAFVDALSVEDGTAIEERVEVDEIPVDEEWVEVELDEAGTGEPLHVPNFELHPLSQYALVFPQYPN